MDSNAATARSAPRAYTRTAVTLHWLVAALVVANLALGLSVIMPGAGPAKILRFSYHRSVGITILALATVRLLWRLTHAPPPRLPMPRWQDATARLLHGALYVLLFAAPLSGWMISSAAGFPPVYLNLWQLPELVHRNRALEPALRLLHRGMVWGLVAAVVLHMAAAIKHHLIDRDHTLRRMLAWRRP